VLTQIIQTGARIFAFTASFVVPARTLAHAAKVNSQGYQARFLQSARRPEDNFVMHCAAAERMRMKNQGGPASG